MAAINISSLPHCWEISREENWVSLLMILFTIPILKPPNNVWQKTGIEKAFSPLLHIHDQFLTLLRMHVKLKAL